MVGRTVIGDVARKAGEGFSYTSLPAEARALNRLFRLAKDRPEWIRDATLDVLAQLPSSKTRDFLFEHMGQSLNQESQYVAFAMESALCHAFQQNTDDNDGNDGDDDDDDKGERENEEESAVIGLTHIGELKEGNAENDSVVGPSATGGSATKAKPITATTVSLSDSSGASGVTKNTAAVVQASTMIVSESSGEEGSTLVPTSSAERNSDEAMAEKSVKPNKRAPIRRRHQVKTKGDFWSFILENMHLQMASRTTSVWGRKKIYEVYRLSGPATSAKTLDEICAGIDAEFARIFCGGDEDHRVYSTFRDGQLYIQLNIGKPFDYHDERNRALSGAKKKKKSNEYIFWVKPGSILIAVTASRAASKSRFTKFVMAAVDLVLSENVNGGGVAERVGDWSGTEPLELLQAARAAETGEAVGRFADYADRDTVLCPLQDLHQATSGSMIDRSKEMSRLEQSALHNREVAQLAQKVCDEGGAELVATGKAGVMINHAAVMQTQRKRNRNDNLGKKDTTKLQRIKWKWTGDTTAATTCWQVSNDMPSAEEKEERPSKRFKCLVSLQGTNIMEGLREMMQAGLTEPVLPDYVRDAPTKGSNTIVVIDGAVEPSRLTQA